MLSLDPKYQPLLLEAVEELLYQTALRLEELKGMPLTGERLALTKKQKDLELLQHQITGFNND